MSGGQGEGSGRGSGASKRDREQEEEEEEEECDKVARLSARLPRNLQEKNGKKSKAAKSDTESDEEETGAGSNADHEQNLAVKHTAAREHSHLPDSWLLRAPFTGFRFSAAACILFVALTLFLFPSGRGISIHQQDTSQKLHVSPQLHY